MRLFTLAILTVASMLSGERLHGQDLEMRPLVEHLEELDQDIGVFRYVSRRCAALFMIVAEVSSDRSPSLSAAFSEALPLFLEIATKAEQRLGSTQEEALKATALAVADIVELYRHRLRNNIAASGSYFADDPFVRQDIQICRSLAGSGSG